MSAAAALIAHQPSLPIIEQDFIPDTAGSSTSNPPAPLQSCQRDFAKAFKHGEFILLLIVFYIDIEIVKHCSNAAPAETQYLS